MDILLFAHCWKQGHFVDVSSIVMLDKCFTYCRVKFYTQEIVFFRQDLLYRMRRSCLVPPSTEETDDYFEHVSVSSIFLKLLYLVFD